MAQKVVQSHYTGNAVQSLLDLFCFTIDFNGLKFSKTSFQYEINFLVEANILDSELIYPG